MISTVPGHGPGFWGLKVGCRFEIEPRQSEGSELAVLIDFRLK